MRIVELKRLKVDAPPTGVSAMNGKVFFAAAGSSELRAVNKRTQKRTASFDTETTRPVGLSGDGTDVYFVDASTSVLYKSPATRFEPTMVIDLNRLDLSDSHPALQTKGAEITDVFVRGNVAYCTVKAGYDSGVYEIALDTGKVRRFFFSDGPEPTGVVQDPTSKNIYVADAGMGYLVEFAADGTSTGNAVKLPTDRPHGLDVDAEANFYVGAEDTGEVVQFRLEEDES